MAHIHGEKAAVSQIMTDSSAMGKMGMGSMMNEGMGPMMGGMGSMMKDGMGPMMGGMGSMMKAPGVAAGVATGAVASAGSSAGKSVIGKIFTHPVVIFGLGVAVGYYLYKYRKSIISTSDEA